MQQYVVKDFVYKIQFDELANILLTSVGQVLLEIYFNYFDHEIRGNYDDVSLKKQDDKVIFEFLRDYDICPTLVSKGVAYKIYLGCIES